MPTRHRSAWQRRLPKGRGARVAVSLAIPVAVAAVIGVIVAVSSGGGVSNVKQAGFGFGGGFGGGFPHRTPTATATASASSSTGTGTTTTTVAPAASNDGGQLATFKLGDVATAPVSGTGTAINLHQTAAEAATSMNCSLTVPNNPLSATGLATPWQLGDGCSMANFGTEGAFVEATILAPNGSVSVYNPLVVTAGTQPAAAPVKPTIAQGSTVEISIGFNGTNLFLTGPGANEGNCVDASGQSVIGQVSTCNAVNFYNVANADIARGTLVVPPLGTATSDGQTCQTTRNFALIDQDQSDNTESEYLLTAAGTTAQATPANVAALNGATAVTNGSDDALLSDFVLPANGCKTFAATDPTNPNGTSGSQALNELSAHKFQTGTTAVTPPNDEMVLVNGAMNITKTNVYRSMVDQPLLPANANPTAVAADYCQNMVNIAPARDQLDATVDDNFTTPVPATGNNLGTFMGNRLSMSFTNLNCGNFGLTDPVTVTLNGNGVATAVTYNTTQQKATDASTVNSGSTGGFTGGFPGTFNPFAGHNGSGTQGKNPTRKKFTQNPSGM